MNEAQKAQVVEALHCGLDAAQDVLAELKEVYGPRGKTYQVKYQENCVAKIKVAIEALK